MDPRFSHITHIFLDADDTLWENDIYFRAAEAAYVDYMAPYASAETARAMLRVKQEDNIPVFGYGSKTYLLGMLDAAASICPDSYGPRMYHDLKDIVTTLATHPFEFLENARDTVIALSRRYRVVIATKGEVSEQMRKYRLSGLSEYITAIEVMEKKSPEDYRNMAAKFGVEPCDLFMVGNAVRSDIAPVVEIGGWAVHIPYKITWEHEIMPMPDSPRILQLTELSQLKEILL